jgi:molybdenum cofactor cytidylyltransferase
MQRTAVILLASGLSRRFGRRDKLMADLCGWPMVDHAAGVLASMDTLTRIAVCPADHREIGERLHDRFVIALNKKPKLGLGHSIATGVNVAMQFKPDVVVLAMADMPFIEPELIEGLVEALGRERADIAHCGSGEGARPPTAFDARCFEALLALSGEDGARSLVSSGRFRVHGIEAPEPLLADVDTREDLDLARRQMEIRSRHLGEPVFLAGR